MTTISKSPYYDVIKSYLLKNKLDKFDPRHIEAYMRMEHGTLDELSNSQFEKEICMSISCIMACSIQKAESLAQSFGL